MLPRAALWFLIPALWAVFGPLSFGAENSSAARPNILYIMSDDHSSSAIGAYGSWLKEVAPTPNIDRLASQGMRFTHCMVTNSICTPSRAAILTGQYSHRNGVYTLADPLDPERDNVAKRLKGAGYQTAVFGKWHLHKDPSGFDFWTILPGQGRYNDPVLFGPDHKQTVYPGTSSDIIAGFAMDWMENRDKNRPFFLMCHFKSPHRPWDPAKKDLPRYEGETMPEPPTLLDDYQNRSQAAANATLKIGEDMTEKDLKGPKPEGMSRDELRKYAYQIYVKDYLRCVLQVDENVGRLMEYLDRTGLAENTVVLYTSDQGMFVGEHGYYDKRFMYEPCLTTPLIIRAPGMTKPGSVCEAMALNIDFAPTFLSLAGAEVPQEMQGRSIVPLLEGRKPADWRKSMYYRYYMHLADHGVPAHYGVRTERYKLIYFYGDPMGMKGAVNKPTAPEWEMFDLEKDPEELRNVYAEEAYAPVVAELKAELARLRAELGDDK